MCWVCWCVSWSWTIYQTSLHFSDWAFAHSAACRASMMILLLHVWRFTTCKRAVHQFKISYFTFAAADKQNFISGPLQDQHLCIPVFIMSFVSKGRKRSSHPSLLISKLQVTMYKVQKSGDFFLFLLVGATVCLYQIRELHHTSLSWTRSPVLFTDVQIKTWMLSVAYTSSLWFLMHKKCWKLIFSSFSILWVGGWIPKDVCKCAHLFVCDEGASGECLQVPINPAVPRPTRVLCEGVGPSPRCECPPASGALCVLPWPSSPQFVHANLTPHTPSLPHGCFACINLPPWPTPALPRHHLLGTYHPWYVVESFFY